MTHSDANSFSDANSLPTDTRFCSLLSLAQGEPLAGTANRVDVWLLLEYTQPWSAKIQADNLLSAAVNAWLQEQSACLPRFRLQFIKQNKRHSGTRRVYVVINHAQHPRMYVFHLDGYEDLLPLDLPALVGDSAACHEFRTHERLFLVCLNGKRDLCCAKFGFPIYKEMAAFAPAEVWQCSHIGGDRFAPNALCFPHGLCYGRLQSGEGRGLIEAYRRNEILTERLRGRTCYPKAVQAAEAFLRRRLRENQLDALTLVGMERSGEEVSRVEFEETERGLRHTLTVCHETRPERSFRQNCRAEEATPLESFRVVEANAHPSRQ